jgi:hypothetical protein
MTPLLTSRTRLILLVLSVVGAVALVGGMLTDEPRAWNVLLVNFLFWSGLGHAGVAFSAMFQATSARWARPLKRVAEGTIAFLPVSAVMLFILLAGVSAWAPWMHEPNAARQAWLNAPAFIVRQVLGFLALATLSLAYVHASIRPDVGQLHETGRPVSPGLARVSGNWRGIDTERQVSQRRQARLSPALLIIYCCVLSLEAFDFVMSLDPDWYSTLAGGISSWAICISAWRSWRLPQSGWDRGRKWTGTSGADKCTTWDGCCWDSVCCGLTCSGRSIW